MPRTTYCLRPTIYTNSNSYYQSPYHYYYDDFYSNPCDYSFCCYNHYHYMCYYYHHCNKNKNNNNNYYYLCNPTVWGPRSGSTCYPSCCDVAFQMYVVSIVHLAISNFTNDNVPEHINRERCCSCVRGVCVV